MPSPVKTAQPKKAPAAAPALRATRSVSLSKAKPTEKSIAKPAVKSIASPVKSNTIVAKVAAKGPGTSKLGLASKPTKPAEVKKVKPAVISKIPKTDKKAAK